MRKFVGFVCLAASAWVNGSAFALDLGAYCLADLGPVTSMPAFDKLRDDPEEPLSALISPGGARFVARPNDLYLLAPSENLQVDKHPSKSGRSYSTVVSGYSDKVYLKQVFGAITDVYSSNTIGWAYIIGDANDYAVRGSLKDGHWRITDVVPGPVVYDPPCKIPGGIFFGGVFSGGVFGSCAKSYGAYSTTLKRVFYKGYGSPLPGIWSEPSLEFVDGQARPVQSDGGEPLYFVGDSSALRGAILRNSRGLPFIYDGVAARPIEGGEQLSKLASSDWHVKDKPDLGRADLESQAGLPCGWTEN